MSKTVISFIVSCLLLTSCGGDSDSSSLNGNYSVQDVNILADDIEIGETVRTEIFFETKTEPDGSPDGLELVIRIPAELDYLSSSAELYDNSVNDPERRSPDEVFDCPSGESYLVFRFQDFELFEKELNGVFGNFGLKFLLVGRSRINETLVGASAGRTQTFTCGAFFEAEQNEAVKVL